MHRHWTKSSGGREHRKTFNLNDFFVDYPIRSFYHTAVYLYFLLYCVFSNSCHISASCIERTHSISTVFSHVIIQATLMSEHFAAFMTHEGHLVHVNVNVPKQSCFLVKCFVTIRTSERFVSTVNYHVHIQVVLLPERFGTFLTNERLLARVSSSMLIQITFICKPPVAIRTSKRLFSSVNSYMLFQTIVFISTHPVPFLTH